MTKWRFIKINLNNDKFVLWYYTDILRKIEVLKLYELDNNDKDKERILNIVEGLKND